MVDCSRIENLLSEYIDGELSRSDFIDVENHLSVCADCRAELAALRTLTVASSEIEAVQPPADLRMRIAAATTQRQRSNRWVALRDRLFAFRPLAWAGSATVAAFALILVISFGRVTEPTRSVATQPKPAAPVAVSPTLPQPATEQVASVEQSPADANLPASRVSTHRVAAKKIAKRAAVVAFVPKAVVVPKVESAKPIVSDTKNADEYTEQTIIVDDTTTAKTVATVQDAEPKTEVVETVTKAPKPDSTKIASSPAISNDNAEEWMAEMKSKAAMQRRGRPSNVVSVISARF